jgi:hypothetical protein
VARQCEYRVGVVQNQLLLLLQRPQIGNRIALIFTYGLYPLSMLLSGYNFPPLSLRPPDKPVGVGFTHAYIY